MAELPTDPKLEARLARQRSNVRVAVLCSEIWRTVGTVLAEDPDLTYEEICVAMNQISARALGHIMSDEETPDGG